MGGRRLGQGGQLAVSSAAAPLLLAAVATQGECGTPRSGTSLPTSMAKAPPQQHPLTPSPPLNPGPPAPTCSSSLRPGSKGTLLAKRWSVPSGTGVQYQSCRPVWLLMR
jgi:hypothetical protein